MLTRRLTIPLIAALAALAVAPTLLPAQTRLARSTDVAPYFPLRVGNVWVYQRSSPATPEREEWRAAVTGRVTARNGQTYFALAGYFGPSRLVRSTLRDTVSELNPDGNADNLWYLLGAPVGTSWTLTLEPLPTLGPAADCVSGSKATLAGRAETLRVPAGEFTGVVRVDYRAPCADAGLVSEWFAPGVGLVRRVEDSFAGPVVSELVRAELGERALPLLPYSSTLSLDRPVYVNNLMPPIGPESVPVVHAVYALRNRTDLPIELVFGGCKSVSVEVVDEAGEVVLRARGDDGGCCVCRSIQSVTLVNDAVAIATSFRLATADGRPLPDGRYAVRATLDVLEPIQRPSATAPIVVRSTH